MPLIAHYPLQEDSGSTAYDVRGGNDGTIKNSPTLGATGLLGTTAYDFDGNDDFIDVPAKPIPPNMTKPFSISLWLKDSDPHSQGETYLLSQQDDGSNDYNGWGFVFVDRSTDTVALKNRDGTSGWQAHFTWDKSVDGNWIHLSVVYDGSKTVSNVKCYLNGSRLQFNSDASKNQGVSDKPANENLDIASRKGSLLLSGKLADVRIYDHALSQTEIQYLYQLKNRGSLVTGKKQI